jgi:lipopolysaccharide transport protein LptA
VNNSAAGLKSGLSQRLSRSTSAGFGGVVVLLLLSIGANCGPLQAQSSKGSSLPAGNPPSAQQTVRKAEKTEKTAVSHVDQNSARNHKQKPASNSNGQDSETPFGSLASSNRGPISIQSDSLDLDYKQNAVLFDGHVHATQADAALTSNKLRVKYGKDFHEVQDMAADGDVHISQGVRWCTSDHAVMDQRQHTVILTGSPICHDASDQIAGTRITVHLDSGKSDVEAAKAMIFPQQSKTRDNEALADQTK